MSEYFYFKWELVAPIWKPSCYINISVLILFVTCVNEDRRCLFLFLGTNQPPSNHHLFTFNMFLHTGLLLLTRPEKHRGGKMSKCFPVKPACTIYPQCDPMSKKVSGADRVGLMAQKTGRKNSTGSIPTNNQELGEHPSVVPRSHQQRWSADFCKCGTSPIITVRKSKKEPQPPQRSTSLVQPSATSNSSVKRYSCPTFGIYSKPRNLYSSSSSSSTSSCSSPPPVPTSVITGPDPLGWRLGPKSRSAYRGAKRLSLQIPLPVVFPGPDTNPAPSSQPDNANNPDPTQKTNPTFRPKPPRRRHSDSLAFLRSLPTTPPVVMLEDLLALHLHPVAISDGSDDVFSGGNTEEARVTPWPRKVPPPVPEKSFMARHKARVIARSRQSCKTDKEAIYSCAIKPRPKPSRQTEDHRSLPEIYGEHRSSTSSTVYFP